MLFKRFRKQAPIESAFPIPDNPGVENPENPNSIDEIANVQISKWGVPILNGNPGSKNYRPTNTLKEEDIRNYRSAAGQDPDLYK